MTRSREFPFAAVVAAIAAIILVGGGILLWKKRPASEDGPSPTPAATVRAETGEPASLYFPATSGMLEVELRAAPVLDPADRRRWLAEQLVAGPEGPNLRPAFPAETQVASVFEAPDGTVYVDFTLPENTGGMGSTEELLTLYSVVNTLLLDDPTAKRAVLLINGRQRETLAGHLDTTRPLYPRPNLIREAG